MGSYFQYKISGERKIIKREIHILKKASENPMTCERCKENKNYKGLSRFPRTRKKCIICNKFLCEECFRESH